MTPPSHRWKAIELEIAKFWDTVRNRGSGAGFRSRETDTRADLIHPTIYFEVKHGQGVPPTWEGVLELFADTEAKAAAEGKTACVVLHPARTKGPPGGWPAVVRIRSEAGDVDVVAQVLHSEARRLLLARNSVAVAGPETPDQSAGPRAGPAPVRSPSRHV